MIFHLKYKIMVALFYLMRIFPVKRNKIVFCSFSGKGFGDNCKYIALELLKQSQKYDLVWLTADGDDESVPRQVRTVKYLSLRSVYEQATAKVWVDNRRKPGYVRKRKNQYYIQTWHAGISLKKVEKDAELAMPQYYIWAAKRDSKMADLFLSSSKWDTECYRRAFWYDGHILEEGLPRQDIIFNLTDEKKSLLKKKIGIDEKYKIAMYAPTFRKNMTEKDLSVYSIDWNNFLEILRKRFGGTWKGMIRLHPNVSKYVNSLQLPTNVLNVTNYPDMQELIAISDVAITDYSSAILEFAMTGRPGFIFAVDLEDYKKDRDLYFSLEELPCPLALSNEQLIENVKLFDARKYAESVRAFYHGRCGLFEGGHASEAVAQIIDRIIFD